MTKPRKQQACQCGNSSLNSFSEDYLHCGRCETLVSRLPFDASISNVTDETGSFYGSQYWYEHQKEMGLPDIKARVRDDLSGRCLHWLNTVLKYKTPPGKTLEIGCSHGAFVSLLRWYGFDSEGLEVSPEIVDFARSTFDIPMHAGKLEAQKLKAGTYDAILLMDVVEHFPSPQQTLKICFNLLKKGGVIIVQTPEYPAGRTYQDLVTEKHGFLEMLLPQEHLYLFSFASLQELLVQMGASEVRRETALFGHYDQYLVAFKGKPSTQPKQAVSAPAQHLVRALLDTYSRENKLINQLAEVEADRAARLELIHRLSDQLAAVEEDREAKLKTIQHLCYRIFKFETDRDNNLRVIEELNRQLSEKKKSVRLRKKTKAVAT